MDRRNAYRMKQEDERILEYLDEHGMTSPKFISREVFSKVSPGHVEERLRMLQYSGLVFCAGLESYELTTQGMVYLRGELDARHQPEPSVERVLRG
jgi:DNA-binding PadR family transcriptional regulator